MELPDPGPAGSQGVFSVWSCIKMGPELVASPTPPLVLGHFAK